MNCPINYNHEPTILVGIMAERNILFELKGNFLLNAQQIPAGNYSVSVDEIRDSKRTYQPQSSYSTFILKNVTIGIGFHWEQQEDQEFEGALTLQIEGDNVRVINEVPLESYLKSVISSEMSAMNDLNLLSAHAIVSRSWLLAQIHAKGKGSTAENCYTPAIASASNERPVKEIVKWYDREEHDTFDVCADDHCQRYQGITKVISANAQHAIESTRGQVLLHENEICDARFSKCCGGISENFENVWQPVKVPYLVAVSDNKPEGDLSLVRSDAYYTSSPAAFCNTSDQAILQQVLIDFDRTTTNFFRWSVEFSQEDLTHLIAKKSGIDFGEIIDFIPLERGKSGRIIRLKIIGTKRQIIVGKELEIRKWLSESHLYSSAFLVEKRFEERSEIPSHFILRGAGWGHGVGMCQIGAAVMSQRGYNLTRILEHYFKGATIGKIYF